MRGYIRDFRPVLVAVDGGAEALVEEGWKPDVIVGDMDSVTDATLRCGAEILVHAYREGGHAPGEARLQRLGVPFHTVAAPGISEDIALLLAHDKGAELIVAVGTHFNLVEFLERSRAGMSSTFVTRLKVGEILIDAKGVSRLVSRRIGVWPLALFGAAALAALLVAMLGLTGAAERVRPLGFTAVFDLRYHVASLAAVFLMLVVGILIGVGISGRGFVDDAERDRFERRDRRPGGGGRRRQCDRRRLRAAPTDGARTSSRAHTRLWPQADSTRRTLPCSCSARSTRP